MCAAFCRVQSNQQWCVCSSRLGGCWFLEHMHPKLPRELCACSLYVRVCDVYVYVCPRTHALARLGLCDCTHCRSLCVYVCVLYAGMFVCVCDFCDRSICADVLVYVCAYACSLTLCMPMCVRVCVNSGYFSRQVAAGLACIGQD